uniref:Membrane progestin receptor beta n=1 Tax=Pyxicephalus adspersus TaxID=30357 RepID=A0AAV3ASK9_PYXAD|nr:TPA: hypothetical protein GDO54_010021 [Pyxicephalus adspersus]
MTTAILECISTLSISAQQLRRLPKLLEGGFLKMPSTVKDSDVPNLFREPYIQTGYRPIDQKWKYYFLSLFQKHNESVNVWTHLLVALAVLLRFRTFVETEGFSWDVLSMPLVLYIIASLTYLICSILAHLLQSKSDSSQAWYDSAWYFFLPGAAFLGWMSCFGCCFAKYRYKRPYPVMRKICQVFPAGIAYILDISPVVQRILACHAEDCKDTAVWFHCLQIILFVMSSYFFSCPVPEKFFPGGCDIVGHGHQIFHVFLGLCTLCQLEAVLLDFKSRQELFTTRYSPELTQVSCVSFFALIMCSTITAAFLREKIKRKLAKKDL